MRAPLSSRSWSVGIAARIRVSSVILANLVIGSDIIPEFLQENCTPDKLAEALVDVISTDPDPAKIRETLRKGGFEGLWDDGVRKVLDGLTTIEEIYGACGR